MGKSDYSNGLNDSTIRTGGGRVHCPYLSVYRLRLRAPSHMDYLSIFSPNAGKHGPE